MIPFLFCMSLLFFHPFFCHAQSVPAAPAKDKIIVGVCHDPPYLIKEENGEWTGFNMSIWKAVAQELKLDYHLKEMTFDDLFSSLKKNKIDISIDMFYVTAERQKFIDYSFPFGNTRLAVATLPEKINHPWWMAVNILFSWGTFKVILVLCCVLCILGFILWLIEHKNNPNHFGGGIIRGIGSGIYWVGSTLASGVCFGVALKSVTARIMGLLWMFICAITLSAFIASLTSSLSSHLNKIDAVSTEELRQIHLGGVKGSAESLILNNVGGKSTFFQDEQSALRAVIDKKIDGFIYDEITLIYYKENVFRNRLSVYPIDSRRFFFAFGFPKNSRIRSKIDYAILSYIEKPEWAIVLRHYGFEENFEEKSTQSFRRLKR